MSQGDNGSGRCLPKCVYKQFTIMLVYCLFAFVYQGGPHADMFTNTSVYKLFVYLFVYESGPPALKKIGVRYAHRTH